MEVDFHRSIMLIRSIEDIEGLSSNHYGLPIFGNFPLVDAIIQPNILIQFTISPTGHKGAVDKLEDIRSQLKGNSKDHMMVFVIPHGNKDTFKYQRDLESIHQYVTLDDPTASAEVLMPGSSASMNSKSQSKHAKRQRTDNV